MRPEMHGALATLPRFRITARPPLNQREQTDNPDKAFGVRSKADLDRAFDVLSWRNR